MSGSGVNMFQSFFFYKPGFMGIQLNNRIIFSGINFPVDPIVISAELIPGHHMGMFHESVL